MKQDRFGLDSDVPAGTFSNTHDGESSDEADARPNRAPEQVRPPPAPNAGAMNGARRSDVDTLVGFTTVPQEMLDSARSQQGRHPVPPSYDQLRASMSPENATDETLEGQLTPRDTALHAPGTHPNLPESTSELAEVRAAVAGAELTLDLLDAPFVGIDAEPDLEGFRIQADPEPETERDPVAHRPPEEEPSVNAEALEYILMEQQDSHEETSTVQPMIRTGPARGAEPWPLPGYAAPSKAQEEHQVSPWPLHKLPVRSNEVSHELHDTEPSGFVSYDPALLEGPSEAEETIQDLLKLQEAYGPPPPRARTSGAPQPPGSTSPRYGYTTSQRKEAGSSVADYAADDFYGATRVVGPSRATKRAEGSAGAPPAPAHEARDFDGLGTVAAFEGQSHLAQPAPPRRRPPPPVRGCRQGVPQRAENGPLLSSSLSPAERGSAPARPTSRTGTRWMAGALLLAAAILLGAFGWSMLQSGDNDQGNGAQERPDPATATDQAIETAPNAAERTSVTPRSGKPDDSHQDHSRGTAQRAASALARRSHKTVNVDDVTAAAPVDDTAFREPEATDPSAPTVRPQATKKLQDRSKAAAKSEDKRPHNGPDADNALPALPSRQDVQAAMAEVRPRVLSCAGRRHGTATVIVTAISTGRVTHALVTGKLSGSAEGSCLARAVRSARLPPFRQVTFQFAYDFRI